MSRILVTGANGQLGNEIRKLSSSSSHEFCFTDIGELDLTRSEDIHSFLEDNPADYIVNCAAYTNVDGAEKEPELAMKLNRDIVANLSSALVAFPGTRLIHISTDYVFPGDRPRPLDEGDATGPQSVYGRTKLEGEKVLDGHPDAMVIRTSWLYGIYGKNFVKNMVPRIEQGMELGIVYDQAGNPTHAADLAAAILRIISAVESGERDFVPGIFHYANEGVCSWYDLTMEISRLLSVKPRIRAILTREYPLPATRPMYSVLNKNKIKEVYGVEVPYWRDSLIKCIDELKKTSEQ